jgi:[acyl-carrier-protein] S-malonyltransferase
MKHAFVFPGQGSQFPGMGKSLYENSAFAKKLFEQANEILGFRISDIMFMGSENDLKQTQVTQPAVFLHSVIAFKGIENERPDMVAGHSLGEFSALVANSVLAFEDALRLVSVRATAMQHACEQVPSTMAAVLGLDDASVEAICAAVQKETKEVTVQGSW